MTRSDRAGFPIAGLAASILVFAWPQLSSWVPGTSAWYPLVTIVFTLLIVGIAIAWPRSPDLPDAGPVSPTRMSLVVAVLAAATVAVAAFRWSRLLAWQPYQADMLIVIREATRRFLSGRTPYTTYRTYDAPWNIAMPYGPGLWGPYLAAQWLRLDFRFLTIIGELFVPLWCGIVAAIESARGRLGRAAAWLAVAAALLLAFDVQGFTLIGHTPIYWPLLALFAAMVWQSRWTEAACLLGLLILARTTMVAIVPVLLIVVWTAERRQVGRVLLTLIFTVGVVMAPFVLWDPRGVWDNMVLSYPRVMRESVWPVLARPGIETIGLTEWLIERHREAAVMPAQVLAMIGVSAAAWLAIRRGAAPLPWMALSLFAFSMTTLYPVHYLYYDVLLLLACGGLVGTLGSAPVKMAVIPWLLSLTVTVAIVAGMAIAMLSRLPQITSGDAGPGALDSGFAMSERDGQRPFSWIVGHEATIVLPRRSAEPAEIALTVQSALDNADASQSVTAILNGTVIGHVPVPGGWSEIRFTAPRSTWWVGFNQLHLVLSATMSPQRAGTGDDPRELAMGVSQVAVTPLKE